MTRFTLALFLTACSLQVNAATYLFEAGGEIDFVPAWADFVEVGDSWSINLRIDSTVSNTSPNPDPAWYPFLEGSVTFGDYSFATGSDFTYAEGQQITLWDDSIGSDSVAFILDGWPTYPVISGYTFLGPYLFMSGPTSLWDSNALDVLEGVEYDDFDDRSFSLFFANTNGDITGTVDRYSMSVVPVPAAVWVFASALGVLGWLRREAR